MKLIKLFSGSYVRCCGSVAMITSLMLPVLIGALAIVVDVPYWRYRSAALQNNADMIALSLARDVSNSITNIVTLAVNGNNEAKKNGCDTSCSVSVAYPYNSNVNSVAVTVTDSNATRFLSFIYESSPKVMTAKSSATIGSLPSYGGNGCILGLSTSSAAAGSVSMSGGASIPSTSCEVYSDGTNSLSSASVNGNRTLVSGTLFATGGITVTGVVGAAKPNQPKTPDPYAGVVVKGGTAYSGACVDSAQAATWGSLTWSLTPGHWCHGWTVASGATLNLSPGTYYLGNNDQAYSGDFVISGGARINATGGVTIVLIDIPSTLSNNEIDISGGGIVNIVAPSSGPTSGVAIMTNTDSKFVRDVNPNTFLLAGGGVFNYTGAIYLPNTNITITGGTSAYSLSNPCTQIVGAQVIVSGGTQAMGNQCSGVGVKAFGTPASWTNSSTGGGTTLRLTE